MSLGAYEYRSFDFFSTYPTGFEVFDINNGGATSLNILEDIGALGPALKGKKVVISFTTDMFNDLEVPPKTYAGSFSQMHANALIFNQDLSLSLKQKIAKRMLDYPDTLTDPVLIFALQNLASGSAWNDFLYYLTVPLGKLEDLIIRLQDHYEVWSYINLHPQINPNVTRNPRNIDWTALLAQATAQQKAATSSNPYGIENDAWNKNYHGYLRVHKPGSSNQKFLTAINNSKEWYDLELELEVLQELGVRPLIMSRPVNGGLFTANGVTPEVQAVYYSRLEKLVSTYHMPLMDFKGYTNDPYFSIDEAAHTGREGWVVIDQTLDAFFHGKLSVEH
jgi:D-alanine transfer protein